MTSSMGHDELELVDRWWRAANYLSVGQIYLRSNPLLREPLKAEHTKSRLLGHWGTTPGLNFVYAHLNRVIRRDSAEVFGRWARGRHECRNHRTFDGLVFPTSRRVTLGALPRPTIIWIEVDDVACLRQ